ncbi:MAG: cupin domain-containing protein [Chloroflexi bacterium]|nr:cupin domain-containing protein [Chloroflexota bacterium]
MKIEAFTDREATAFPGVEGVTIRWMIGKRDDAPNFAMRVIEVEPGCQTPFHSHDYEHEVFILQGEGVIKDADAQEHHIETGSTVFIRANEEHGFYNRGEGVLRFICMVPHVEGLEPVGVGETGDVC